MITRYYAVRAATRAARAASGLPAWCLPDLAGDHAAFVERYPEAPAEALYQHAMRGARVTPWRQAGPEIRTAVEVFRASFLALSKLIEAAPATELEQRGELARACAVLKAALGPKARLAPSAPTPWAVAAAILSEQAELERELKAKKKNGKRNRR